MQPQKRRAGAVIGIVAAILLLVAGIWWEWRAVEAWRLDAVAAERWAAGPPRIAIWYWHSPFRLSPAEAAQLQEMRVRELFVLAATLTQRETEETPAIILPQIWRPAPAGIAADTLPSLHLVFRADTALLRRFDAIPIKTLQAVVLSALRQERAQAKRAGWRVTGVQLDWDLPTRLLPKYGQMLQGLREALKEGQGGAPALSITALPTWYSAPRSFATARTAVDFVVPQFYEGAIAAQQEHFTPIYDPALLRQGLRAAERAGTPYFAGLPAYGHALVYDGEGKLRGMFHDFGAADALRHTDTFRLQAQQTLRRDGRPAAIPEDAIGEDVLDFGPASRAVTMRGGGAGADFHLLYELPTPEMVQSGLVTLREKHPAHCLGVALFRWPEGDDSGQALPLATLNALLQGQPPAAPTLKIRLRVRPRAPWRLIDASAEGAQEPPAALSNLFVDVSADGPFGSRIAPDAVTVFLALPRSGLIQEVSPGGFDTATAATGAGARVSVLRADAVRLSLNHLTPGRTVTAGPIALDWIEPANGGTPLPIAVSWRTVAPEGFSAATGKQSITLGQKAVTDPR